MSFLTPLFLAGLGAIAIPVLIHLIQREKKRVVEFPSLMFVRRIPYQSVRRRRIRHWALLLMRAAAIALMAAIAHICNFMTSSLLFFDVSKIQKTKLALHRGASFPRARARNRKCAQWRHSR